MDRKGEIHKQTEEGLIMVEFALFPCTIIVIFSSSPSCELLFYLLSVSFVIERAGIEN